MIWLGLTLTALAGVLWAESANSRQWTRRFKPVASVGFLGWALHHGALETSYGQAIFAGLVLSWFGDVFLLSKKSSWFLAGLVPFLAAHVAYIVAFVGLGPAWSSVAMIAAAMTVVAWAVRRWLRPTLPEKMKRPVDVYIVVITMMVATAFAAWRAGAPPAMLAGAIAFYLSDLSVARDRFISTSFTNRLWGLPLYYVAQLLLGSTC